MRTALQTASWPKLESTTMSIYDKTVKVIYQEHAGRGRSFDSHAGGVGDTLRPLLALARLYVNRAGRGSVRLSQELPECPRSEPQAT